jgi:hypothetical protein
VSKLVQLLEDAAVVAPTRQQPMAALAAGPAATRKRGELPHGERSHPTVADEPELLLQAALVELRQQEPEIFSQRIEELG